MTVPMSLLVAAALVAPAAPVPGEAGSRELEALWAELEKDEPAASRALLKLSARPKEVVGFLKAKVKPLAIDEKRVRALIADLGAEKEETWKAAFEELEYFDPRLAIDLPTLMADVTDTPARQRLVAVLCAAKPDAYAGRTITLSPVGNDGYNFRANNGSWWAEHKVERLNAGSWTPKKKWTRATRAVALLEHLGTPAAVAVLEDLARGHADAQPTKAAKDALKRLGGAK
jgi:hypothetical protein